MLLTPVVSDELPLSVRQRAVFGLFASVGDEAACLFQ